MSALAAQTSTDRQDLRHEIKFVSYASEYSRLLNWLRLRSVGFYSPYSARRINNAYFDTWDYRAFAENLAGVSARRKLRYRWYGSDVYPAAGVLELKEKQNLFGWKKRFSIATAPHSDGDSWRDIIEKLRQQLPAAGKLHLDQNPMPVMINRYDREYFVTADGIIRATIDRHQQVFEQRYGALPNVDRIMPMQDTIVMEFKFPASARPAAMQILNSIPLRIGRHSKYMNAMRALSFA